MVGIQLNINFKEPYAVIVSPTADDMKRRSFNRYFVKKNNDSRIIEIDKIKRVKEGKKKKDKY